MKQQLFAGWRPALAVIAIASCSAAAQDRPSGSDLFANHCAACHGAVAEGDGPVAAAMRGTVPNLRTLSERSGGTFPRDAVMAYVDGREMPAAHGDRIMPVWGDALRPSGEEPRQDSDAVVRERIEAIVDFLLELQYRD